MHWFELFSSAVGALAFAFTFHTHSSCLRVVSAVLALVLFVRIEKTSRRNLSCVYGALSILGCYFWMPRIAPSFFHVSGFWGVPIWLAFSLYEGSIFLFAWALSQLLKRRIGFLSLPVAWFALESLFPHIVPWHWANLFLDLKPLVLGVRIFGAPAFAFLVFLLAAPLLTNSKSSRVLASLSLCLLLIASSFQARTISRLEANAKSIRLGLVQNNLDPSRDFRPEKRFENLELQRRLSQPLLAENVDLIIWPESAVHFDYPEHLRQLPPDSPALPLPGSLTPVLFGTQTLLSNVARGNPQYYFSSLMIGRDGMVLGRYDKHFLLPFSESVPFMEVLPFLRRVLPSDYELRAGTSATNLSLPSPLGASVVPSICYEDLFSSTFSAPPPNSFLLSQANDAWFLDSAAAEQHYFLSRLRAVEQGKYFVRVTTSGISAVVTPFGEESLRLPSFAPITQSVSIPLL